MSSLIQGVYLLQQEKQVNPLTNRWWESFGFSLATILINQDDGSIYGAVFENNKYQNEHYSEMRPRSVIAFRGTLLKSETWYSDVKEGMRCFFNNLNKGSRFQQATQAVKNVLEKHPTETTSVWLAGHSLGAGIALMVGRTLAKDRFPLKTFAFNPPILLSSLGIIPNIDVFKGMFLFAESCIKVAVVAYQQTQEDDPRLAAWTPYLYVNPSDGFCSECIDIFKYKTFMACIGLGKFERISASISLRCLTFGIESGEPILLLSSADMLVNMNKSDVETSNVLEKPLKKAHGLEQWWETANWKIYNLRP
ncbi:GDSL esterase/lipase At4g10955-like isoform X2 [Raphanus sativus]|nr:GDSL esterase/lipase At4g10955-like isoform X2 [Raphanus sativus]XP_056849881.1 GDSL esterase/lipase At4g10955-like isoform X2 [Raphanus sativus]XP_056849882.1 GDSL esterase/lipase At4g10955-like isoform X2 [Raphanus sativus]